MPPLIASAEGSLKGDKAPITLAFCWDLLNEATKARAESEGRAKAPSQTVQDLRQAAASYAEKAQAKYEEAAKSSPQNSRVLRQVAAFYMKINKPDQAELLLKQIISLQSPATLTDVCWARRNLAIILKSRGDFDHFC